MINNIITRLFLACCIIFLVNASSIHGQDQESAIIEKNLFSPDRKPPENSQAEGSAAGQSFESTDFQLYGIIMYTTPEGLEKRAIVRLNRKFLPSDSKDEYVHAKEGQTIGPFKVVTIEKDKISVEYSGRSYIIPLYSPAKKQTPPPPPVPTALSKTPEQAGENVPRSVERQSISPEEFRQLSPEEKEKLIERMKKTFIKRLESMAEKGSKE